MNLPQKLLSSLMLGLCLAIAPVASKPVTAEALEQDEIRSLARNITVKIVHADTSSNGSGVLFSRKNNVYSVLTNQHVAGDSGNYEIYTADGTKHQITFKEEIPGLDLMVVQFESNLDYETAEVGDSEEIAPLQLIYVAGYPAIQADLDIVDGKIRSIRQDVLQNPQQDLGYALVYTNQTLPGSSGGAILDERGHLVGINGEAERDIRSGRDISRGIPINLFISLSFNYLPEDQFEVEEDDSEEELARIEQEERERQERERQEELARIEREERERQEELAEAEQEREEVAYLPTAANDSNYALAFNIAQPETEIKSVAITPDGRTIVTGGDNLLKVWNGQTGSLEKTFTAGEEDEINSVAISADGNTIISSFGEKIKIWNRSTGQLERTLEDREEEINSIALSLDGSVIVSGSDDSKVRVWNRYTGQLLRTLEGHEEEIKSVAISADGKTIVSGSQDREVKVWDWNSWVLKQTLKGHEEEVRAVAISADGQTIISGSGDKTIKVWDLGGQLKATLRGHEKKVDTITISNNGYIISGSRDRTIKIWNLQTQTLEQSLFVDNSEGIQTIAASANKGIVVGGSEDDALTIWHQKP